MWRRPQNEDGRNLYDSSNIVRVIKSRSMRLAGHVARTGETGNTMFWLENMKGKDNLEDIGVDGSIILEWILGK
jgi:hypothetical protein